MLGLYPKEVCTAVLGRCPRQMERHMQKQSDTTARRLCILEVAAVVWLGHNMSRGGVESDSREREGSPAVKGSVCTLRHLGSTL